MSTENAAPTAGAGQIEKRPAQSIRGLKRTLNQAGQGMTEYIMIIGLVALLVYAAVNLFGKDIQGLFNQANNDLSTISNNATN
jgi:Flp pilus assembly pilin Flp